MPNWPPARDLARLRLDREQKLLPVGRPDTRTLSTRRSSGRVSVTSVVTASTVAFADNGTPNTPNTGPRISGRS